jgi:hypothetical protein
VYLSLIEFGLDLARSVAHVEGLYAATSEDAP